MVEVCLLFSISFSFGILDKQWQCVGDEEEQGVVRVKKNIQMEEDFLPCSFNIFREKKTHEWHSSLAFYTQ